MPSRIARSPSLRIAGKRLLQAIPIVLAATFLTFTLLNLRPGNAAVALLGEYATPEDVAALSAKLGLDKPFFERYLDWLGGILQGDFGNSLATGLPVGPLILDRLWVSLELVAGGIVLALGAAIPVAVLAARRPRGVFDRLSVAVSMLGVSTPTFVIAFVLVYLFAVLLRLLPPSGFSPLEDGLGENLRFLILPMVALAAHQFCVFSRLLRADLVDQLQSEDYVTTARAKGVRPWTVLTRHALRNSLFGLLTVTGLQLGTMLGSTVVIELVFAVPGMGQELQRAIHNFDIPVVQSIVVVIAIFVVLINLVADLLYAVLDPRLRHEHPNS